MGATNSVNIQGRLTKDVELGYMPNGVPVVNFNLAVNRTFKSENGQEADFVPCKAYRKTAENMARYLQKGSLISVSGRIETSNYTNKQGQRVFEVKVNADEVVYLESRNQNNNNQNNNNYNNYNNNQRNNNNGFDNFFNDKSRGNARSNFSDFGQDFPSNMDDDFLSDVVNPFSE